jgi:hypothetical protein
VLGKYVVQMLEGELAPELKEKWAWDRARPDPALFADFPRFEMKDLIEDGKEKTTSQGQGQGQLRAKL